MLIERAIQWLHRNSLANEGIVVSSRSRVSYPEVTGYLIPTLLQCGERELAHAYARWLVTVQKRDGSFANPGGSQSYAFDTGQVARGLVAALPDLPELEHPLRKACDWLVRSSTPEGRLPIPASESDWSLGPRGFISEGVHLYALPPLLQAGMVLHEPGYVEFARKSLEYYLKTLNLSEFRQSHMLTHLFCYIQEALFDLGAVAEARRGMNCLAAFQQPSGALPGYHDVTWVCTPGQIQAAIVWYKLGEYERGNRALSFIENYLNPSGGFFGSYGVGADYFQTEEISWATKFYLDAAWLRIQKFFDKEHAIFPDTIAADDGRLQAILAYCGNLNGKKVLDVGCGKGRFATAIKQLMPAASITGIDVSAELLKSVPAGIATLTGSMLSIPLPDQSFDCIYCVEALEHAVRLEPAVREMCRLLRPGGKIVIIDKNAEHWGKLATPDWEQWFTPAGLTERLRQHCGTADFQFIGYADQKVPDGLFVAWQGTKAAVSPSPRQVRQDPAPSLAAEPHPLDAAGWHSSLIGGTPVAALAADIRAGVAPEWLGPLLDQSKPGDTLVELGSGTGVLSAHLAVNGRKVVLVDYSPENLAFSRELFGHLGLSADFVLADVTNPLPFPDNHADIVWSSGLLEHFPDETILGILVESRRITKRKLISLVPNAQSIAYRLGKWHQETTGTWQWGREEPKYSLKELFHQAGLNDVEEFSVSAQHSLSFLAGRELAPAANLLGAFFAALSADDLARLNQGYLLATVGCKKKPRRLAVIPSDPLRAYVDAGYGDWLTDYYNPSGYFDEVYCLSPLEPEQGYSHGMNILPTPPEELSRRLKELEIDVVRAYGGFWPCDMACDNKVAGIPVVVSVHDSSPLMLHQSIVKADHVLSISKAVRNLVESTGVEAGRIIDFTNRVDLARFRPLTDESARDQWVKRFPGRFRILHVGRKSHEKNLDTLIKSLKVLGPEYVALFVGMGDETPYRNLAREQGVEQQCSWIPSVSSRELPAYYSFCDVMCTPSRREGFGIVFIEALACEAVVVTSNIMPMNEYITHRGNGLLVDDYENPAALAATIAQGCTDRELRASVQRAARHSIQAYSKENVDRCEAGIYEAIITNRQTRSDRCQVPHEP